MSFGFWVLVFGLWGFGFGFGGLRFWVLEFEFGVLCFALCILRFAFLAWVLGFGLDFSAQGLWFTIQHGYLYYVSNHQVVGVEGVLGG